MRLLACPRSPSRMKLWRERIALMICGTTVSSYPTMPGNTAASPLARSRAVRFSRNSSLTWRVRKSSSGKVLRRRSPSVRGRLMKGTPGKNKYTNKYFCRLYARSVKRADGLVSARVRCRQLFGVRGRRDEDWEEYFPDMRRAQRCVHSLNASPEEFA